MGEYPRAAGTPGQACELRAWPVVLCLRALGTHRDDYAGIDVGIAGHEGHDVIDIAGLCAVHEVERQFIDE
ncbi:hypothetical protein [Streptomyces sp. NPDC002403]